MSHMLGNVPQEDRDVSLCLLVVSVTASYLDLSFAHDLVHDLVVVLVEHALVVTVLVAKDPQVLGALQLDLELLFNHTEKENNIFATKKLRRCSGKRRVTDFVPMWLCGVSEDSGLGLADKVPIRVHFQGAVEI